VGRECLYCGQTIETSYRKPNLYSSVSGKSGIRTVVWRIQSPDRSLSLGFCVSYSLVRIPDASSALRRDYSILEIIVLYTTARLRIVARPTVLE